MFIIGLLLGSVVSIIIMSLMLSASYNNENSKADNDYSFNLKIVPEAIKKEDVK